ncbi:hypothetical protein DCMF_21125 [Candidatus Formimonas warabiya]|uniref:DUF304 domain-containing protein n=1 Tax=Formimonas warabiya TaxID=1761012 RepID=A0A3G1KWS1_FORW1|nr:hypothetical protein DCMF_21125 [Candidatus Formimonas warabiya]
MIFLPIWIISCIIILYNCFGKKIEIDEYGVRFIAIYKKHELIWSEIKEIGISNLFVGYRGGAPVIYFSTQYNVGNYISTEMIGDNLILMRYRKSAIKEIRKYWPSDIFGYNQK